MAEEQRWQEGHRLCANNCDCFGSPATLDLCSKCFHDHQRSQEIATAGAASCPSSAFAPSSSASIVAGAEEAGDASPAAAAPRRCGSCRRRVRLTGFACRCGGTFCGEHRYPERHACGFDYRAAGRDAIARANPVVKADKLHHKI